MNGSAISEASPRKTVILRFCRFDDLPLERGRCFTVGEREIVILRTRDGQVAVTDHTCPLEVYPAWVDKAGWVILELPAVWPGHAS